VKTSTWRVVKRGLIEKDVGAGRGLIDRIGHLFVNWRLSPGVVHHPGATGHPVSLAVARGMSHKNGRYKAIAIPPLGVREISKDYSDQGKTEYSRAGHTLHRGCIIDGFPAFKILAIGRTV
jgi:hypothetical protein